MRSEWIVYMERVARPVLAAGSQGALHASMPIEHKGKNVSEHPSTHLEAIGRTLAGLAPWLELDLPDGEEAALQREFRQMALATIQQATAPGGNDRCDFTGNHAIVDAAFLAHALIRAPRQLAGRLSEESRSHLVDCFKDTRIQNRPWSNNWLLFAGMIESALDLLGEEPDYMRIDYALRQHEQWYKGDGVYGDGCWFHMDYYNSYVIHPMIVDIAERYNKPYPGIKGLLAGILERFTRYSEIQERMIGPDGTFPPVGRSLTYRAGAFQALAQAALQGRLAPLLAPAGVRGALFAVIERTLSPAGTFDGNGWLRPGLAGYQPALGETYISTGSLYLCCAAFLPLGLPEKSPFWADADCDWTAKALWAGVDAPCDHALTR